ncbi:MAG TPA: Spy/CpxP family protein refolding chaperone [Telmatospirillum sp.]|nr:Spy/CpxP family protein refolding chaperone [Telmatospirillum sp.]
MSVRKFLMVSVFSLFSATTAFAQGAPANPPPGDPSLGQPPAGRPDMMRREEDPVLRHKTFCSDHYAHDVARLAYLEAKLDLTEKQRSAWVKWQQWQVDGADKERAACLSEAPKSTGMPSFLDHEAQLEKALTIKLQNLQSSRPALEALYESLTPAQRSVFDRPPHGDHFAPPHGAPLDHPGSIPPAR